MIDRRSQLRELYGFDFPDDFFRFWDFANRLQPLDPLNALAEFSIQLVGPFEVLAGRFDGRTPRLSFLLHWRYSLDPPEFFTVLNSFEEGYHCGYYFDDPPGRSRCVASIVTDAELEIAAGGEDLFEEVRLKLEEAQEDAEMDGEEQLVNERDHETRLAELAELRSILLPFATAERRETGAAYADRYAGVLLRQEDVIADTYDGIGIVGPPESYRRLSHCDEKLWNYLCMADDPIDVVKKARRALRRGFACTALKLGKDLWAIGGERHTEYAYELLDTAYAALGREVLREVLRVHRANRDLPSVDILDYEE